MYKKNLERLFAKDMTRREFLAQVGTGLLVLVGVKGLMSHLLGESGPTGQKPSASDYGTSNYGE
jgi:hypothetical protein